MLFLFCESILSPETYESRGEAVRATWLPRCDQGSLFFSEDEWTHLSGGIKLDVPEGDAFLFCDEVFVSPELLDNKTAFLNSPRIRQLFPTSCCTFVYGEEDLQFCIIHSFQAGII